MRGGSDVPLKASAMAQRPAKGDASRDAPGGIERRRAPRVRTSAFLDGGIDGDAKRSARSFMGTTVDLSTGGCLFRTYETLDPGEDVTVTLKLPEGDLRTPARVVRVNEDAIGCRMCGVQFEPLAADSLALLARHISRFGVDPAPASGTAKTVRLGRAGSSKGSIVVEGRVDQDSSRRDGSRQ